MLERQVIYSALQEFCQSPLFSASNISDSDWGFLVRNLQDTELTLRKAETYRDGAMKEFQNVMKLSRALIEIRKSVSQRHFTSKIFDISWLDFDYRSISPSLDDNLSLCKEATKSILADQKLHDALEYLRPDVTAPVMKKPLQYSKECISSLSRCIDEIEIDGVETLEKRTRQSLLATKTILIGRQAVSTSLSKKDMATILQQLRATIQNNSLVDEVHRDYMEEIISVGLELQYRYFEKYCKEILISQQVTGAVGKITVPGSAASNAASSDVAAFISFQTQVKVNSREDEISIPYFTSLQRCCQMVRDLRDLVLSNLWVEIEKTAVELRQEVAALTAVEKNIREGFFNL